MARRKRGKRGGRKSGDANSKKKKAGEERGGPHGDGFGDQGDLLLDSGVETPADAPVEAATVEPEAPPAESGTALAEPPTVPVTQFDTWMKEWNNWGRWGEDDALGALNLIPDSFE